MKYVDHDGTFKRLVCAHCGGDIVLLEETENSKTHGCACGKTRWFAMDLGELDLGLVKADEGDSDYEIFPQPNEFVEQLRKEMAKPIEDPGRATRRTE